MRSRGTPRIANRLLRRVRDWAIVHDLIVVRPDDVKEALALYQIDSEGSTGWTSPCSMPSCATSTVDPWA